MGVTTIAMTFSLIPLWISALFTVSLPEITPYNTLTSSSDIPWTVQKRLSWNDFAGNPSADNPHHALTTTNMELKVKCENNKIKFKVEAVFDPKQSWTRNTTSALLLAHEQLHFDLTELHARQLRKTLSQLPTDCSSSAVELNNYANQAFENWHKEQDLYDLESRHGLHKQKQQEWAASVELRLKALEAFR